MIAMGMQAFCGFPSLSSSFWSSVRFCLASCNNLPPDFASPHPRPSDSARNIRRRYSFRALLLAATSMMAVSQLLVGVAGILSMGGHTCMGRCELSLSYCKTFDLASQARGRRVNSGTVWAGKNHRRHSNPFSRRPIGGQNHVCTASLHDGVWSCLVVGGADTLRNIAQPLIKALFCVIQSIASSSEVMCGGISGTIHCPGKTQAFVSLALEQRRAPGSQGMTTFLGESGYQLWRGLRGAVDRFPSNDQPWRVYTIRYSEPPWYSIACGTSRCDEVMTSTRGYIIFTLCASNRSTVLFTSTSPHHAPSLPLLHFPRCVGPRPHRPRRHGTSH